MIPSVKTLQTALSLTRPDALRLRKLLEGRLDPESFASVQQWRAQCFHWPPRRFEMVLCAANEILGTHGVEAIEGTEHVDNYSGCFCVSYCNTGDTYAATLLYDHRTGRYSVGSWGDVVEREGL